MMPTGLLGGVFLSLISAVFLNSFAVQAGVYDSLTPSQKRIVQTGQQVVVFQEVEGEFWPKSEIYQWMNASPEEVMAVLADYARQYEFVHRVAASAPTETDDPCVTEIDYKIDLPLVVRPFFCPDYKLKNKITYLGPEEGYQMDWHLLSAKSIKRLEGRTRVEPMKEGGSLISYINLITPVSDNSILKSDFVMVRVKRGGGEALQSIIDRVAGEKRTNPHLLQQQINHLRSAVGPR